jgi:Ca2+-binding EF-hand superfamily protein
MALGRALRWIGYQTAIGKQHELIKAVDIDGSGSLNFIEFQKCVRKCREAEVEHLSKSFQHRARMDKSDVSSVIVHLFGRIPLNEEIDLCIEGIGDDDGLDFMDVAHVVHNFRRLDANIRHNNAGFTDEEVATLETKFHLNQDPNTLRVPCSRARHLMEMLTKNHIPSATETQVLEEVINEAEHDVHGGIEFADFLHFARAVKDARETTEFDAQLQARLAEEEEMHQICTEYSITQEQIQEYRDVFGKFDIDGNGELSVREVLLMVKHVRDLTFHQEVVVMRTIKELDVDGSGSTGFKEFLRLLHRLESEGILNHDARNEAVDPNA